MTSSHPSTAPSGGAGRDAVSWAQRFVLAAILAVLAVPGVLLATGVVTTTSMSGPSAPLWDTAESSAWPADAVIYHVFVDRFADGDAAVATQVAGHPDDPEAPAYAAALTDWMGGDLAGIEARLDHVVATGANTVWLSPVNTGPAFHGYHPTDLLDVDPRFGDVEGLRTLIAAAQARGVRVIYDLVLNHTSDRHPWFLEAQSDCAGSVYVEWYRFSDCPDSYAAFAGLPELPQLDLDHPPVREWVFDEVLPFYLDDLKVDGFRLDHVEGPSRDFWRTFDGEVAARWPDTLILGEVWSQPATINSYGDVLDAATAFPLRDRLIATFARGGDVRAVAMPVLAGLDEDGLPVEGPPRPQTYLSSHDQPRFAWEARGDGAELARDRLALAYTAILTLPGLPTIYYGDEVGMSQTDSLPAGSDYADRWFREPMPWDADVWGVREDADGTDGADGADGADGDDGADGAEVGPNAWDPALLERIAAVARARTTLPALHSGRYLEVIGVGEVWVFERRHGDERLLVALNNGEVAVDVADVLADAGWPDLPLLADAAVVVAGRSVVGGADGSADGGPAGGANGSADAGADADAGPAGHLGPLDAVVLRLSPASTD